jgi:hypothetical protein
MMKKPLRIQGKLVKSRKRCTDFDGWVSGQIWVAGMERSDSPGKQPVW